MLWGPHFGLTVVVALPIEVSEAAVAAVLQVAGFVPVPRPPIGYLTVRLERMRRRSCLS